MYGIDENELNTISSLNTQTTAFFSIFSILFTLVVTFLIERLNTESPTEDIKMMSSYGFVTCYPFPKFS